MMLVGVGHELLMLDLKLLVHLWGVRGVLGGRRLGEVGVGGYWVKEWEEVVLGGAGVGYGVWVGCMASPGGILILKYAKSIITP